MCSDHNLDFIVQTLCASELLEMLSLQVFWNVWRMQTIWIPLEASLGAIVDSSQPSV
jgi:hypothetical protein